MRALVDLPDLSQMNEFELFSVIEQLPYATGLWDVNLRYLYFNKAGEIMSGIAIKDAAGKTPFDMMPPELCDIFVPLLYKARDEKCIVNEVITMNFGQGDIYLKVTYSPIYDEKGDVVKLIGITEDITFQTMQSKQLEEREKHLELVNNKLEQKKRELETIIKEAPTPIILHQEDGSVLLLNQAWVDYSGYTIEDIPTIDTCLERMYDDTEVITSVKNHIHSLYKISKKVDDGEFTFLDKNRDLVTWHFYSAPLGMIDGKKTVISTATDITELKRKGEMLITQSRYAAMGELIGMIAHQWRQPLSAISSAAANIKIKLLLANSSKNKTTDEIIKGIEDIETYVKRLSLTIDDFRNFYKDTQELQSLSLETVISKAIHIVNSSLISEEVEVVYNYTYHDEVQVNENELIQVVLNILKNSQDNFKEKNIQHPRININVTDHCIEICDNGGGINEDIIEKIFDPYFSTKELLNGSGIGLYMSKTIIEEHHKGSIKVENTENGVCFQIRLWTDN